jgi:hypothetical protein
MSFVFPALLGTLIAAGIPVALHLMMRPKPRTLPFPAFRFLVAKQRANQRSLRLRHLLLLLLRMVLIAGLILAIARPRMFQQNLGLSTERPVYAVFVFDTSPSMDYTSSDQRTRLDDAKKRAEELKNALPKGSRIEIRTTADRPGEPVRLEIATSSPPLNAAVVAGLKELADAALKRDDEATRKMPRLLCIFSDTTRGSWDPAQSGAVETASDLVPPTRDSLLAARAEVANLLAMKKETPDKFADVADFEKNLQFLSERIPRLGPADFPLQTEPADLVRQARRSIREALRSLAVAPNREDKEVVRWETALRKTLHALSGQETLWFDVGMNPLNDIAIVRVDPERGGEPVETFSPDEEVTLRVVVEAAGHDFQTTLTCEHEAGKIARPIAVKAGGTETVRFELPLTELKLGPGSHSVTLSLDVRDSWLGNNRRFATFQVREPKKILVVSERPEKPGELQDALRANRFAVETAKPAAVEAAIPANVDAVFLYGLANPTPALWETLKRFVQEGGGLGVIPGDQTMKKEAYKSPLLPGEFKFADKVAKKSDDGVTWSYEPETIFRHPILKPFQHWTKDANIDFVKYPRQAQWLWDVAPDQGTLIRYSDGHPALLEKTVGAGKVLQFTTTLDLRQPAWNNYLESLTSFYVVLVSQTAKHLTGDDNPVRCNFTTPGDEPVVWARGWAGKRVTPTGPGKLDPIMVPADAVRLPIPQATIPGNYRILDADGKTPLAGFSVNLTPEEVAPTRLPAEIIENIFGDGAIVPADRRADLGQLLAGHLHEPIELYPYFMVGILLLLALENLLSNRFYRRSAGEAS